MKDSLANLAIVLSVLAALVALGIRILDLGGTTGPESLAPVQLAQAEWEDVQRNGHRLTRATSSPSATIVYFTDFQCPYCARFERYSLPGALAEFPGQLNVILRHWPLPPHQAAYPAAKAFECAASQGRAVEYHSALVKAADTLSSTSFEALAATTQISDPMAFSECLNDSTIAQSIDADVALATSLNGLGTPLVVLDGKLFRAAPDSSTFVREIRELLSR